MNGTDSVLKLLHYKFLFIVLFIVKNNEENAGSAQYKIKRIKFLIYLHIAEKKVSWFVHC